MRRRPALAALLAVSAAAALTVLVGMLVYNAQLGAALQESEDNLHKARRAERAVLRQLAIAEFRQAQAHRNSGRMGRRFDSLKALKTAADHLRALDELNEERALELRNEAIASLLLADLKPGKERPLDPDWTGPCAFDPTLQFYVVHSAAEDPAEKSAVPPGDLSVRRAADDQEVARLPGFGVRAVGSRFSPDGRYLAVHYEWRRDRHIYVWDVARREAIVKVGQGDYEVFPAFSPDSRLVALPRPDHTIRIYKLSSGAIWKVLPPGPRVHIIQFHPDGRRLSVVTGDTASTVQIRDLNDDGKELAAFPHPGRIHSLAWRSDGEVFATGCYDTDIYLWNVANSGQPLRTVKGHVASVFYVGFSRGGDLLASDSWDSTSRLWDPMTGQQLLFMPGGSWVGFGPDGQGLEDAWQVAGGRVCRTFHGQKYLRSVAISPTGQLMASVGTDGVELWDLAATGEGDKHLATLPVGYSIAVHFGPKGESLFTDSNRVGLQRWPITPDPQTGGVRIGPPESLGLSARAPFIGWDPDFALSADGRTVAHCPEPGLALLYDPENPRSKRVLDSSLLRHAAFSPDGRWLATGNWHGWGARVWDVRTGELERVLDLAEPGHGAAWPAFSPDGKWLVTGTYGEFRFWEVGSWQGQHSLPRAKAARNQAGAAFAPDSKLLAVLHGVSEVHLVDPATGREFARLPAAGCPHCFSPDGSQLVTHGVRSGAFQVWDLRLIRRQLKELDLDWDLPPYPAPSETAKPLSVEVLAAEPPPPSARLDARAHRERGLLQVQLRKYARAGADFRRAENLAPPELSWEEVVRAYDRAIAQNPEDAEAYDQRAAARARLGHWEKVFQDHSKAMALAPQRLDFLACRAKTYLRMGQKERAAEDFRKAAAGKADLANWLAWDLVVPSNPSEPEQVQALKLAQLAVRLTPGDANYWNTLGVAYYRAREWKAAVQALEDSEKLAPGKYLGLNAFFLALCHQQLGDPTRARDYYDRAVRWWQESQGKLSARQQEELKYFRVEAEALLSASRPGA
jgi:WD40 repeat protein/tetratricopeptide (TPR) repeat protein